MILMVANTANRLANLQPRQRREPPSTSSLSSHDDMTLLAARISHLVTHTDQHLVGDFISPRAWQLLGNTPIWAADNDAYSGFRPDRYLRMLDAILAGMIRRHGKHPPAFITVPDVVCDFEKTMDLYYDWHKEVGGRGLARCLVLQNGIEKYIERFGWNALPWEDVEAVFIGGDTPFKFCEEVRWIVRAAKTEGKWVHMGRVNSVKRMRYAMQIGCDSCDGSGMARFPNAVLFPMLKALKMDEATHRFGSINPAFHFTREPNRVGVLSKVTLVNCQESN